jgi:hypothetical protein
MKHVSLLLAAALLTSCASHEGLSGSAAYAPAAPAAKSRSERIIRKDGSMAMKSRALGDSVTKCVSLVEAHHGVLQSANLTEDDYRATIRVPSTSLEPLMDSLAGVGRVTSRRVSAEDVTAEYHDLEAGLANKRALRDRLRLLLAKATTIKDTLAIEKELARVQTELDVLEGRMKLLRSLVARSTLQLNIDREHIPGPLGAVTKGAGWTLKKLFVLN